MTKKFQPSGESIPNLAPMVDVIMVLLIFFLLNVSVNLVAEGAMKTELDSSSGPAEGAPVQVDPLIRISLGDVEDGKSAKILLMDQDVGDGDFDRLRRMLTAKRQAGADVNNQIVILPETRVRWKFVVKAMDAALLAGFKNVQFAVSAGEGRISGK